MSALEPPPMDRLVNWGSDLECRDWLRVTVPSGESAVPDYPEGFRPERLQGLTAAQLAALGRQVTERAARFHHACRQMLAAAPHGHVRLDRYGVYIDWVEGRIDWPYEPDMAPETLDLMRLEQEMLPMVQSTCRRRPAWNLTAVCELSYGGPFLGRVDMAVDAVADTATLYLRPYERDGGAQLAGIPFAASSEQVAERLVATEQLYGRALQQAGHTASVTLTVPWEADDAELEIIWRYGEINPAQARGTFTGPVDDLLLADFAPPAPPPAEDDLPRMYDAVAAAVRAGVQNAIVAGHQ